MDAREIIDSRGNPTIEVDLYTDLGMTRASAPSGASTGTHEAYELRDGGKRYLGKGVLTAVRNAIEKIGPSIVGFDETDQRKLDEHMIHLDGTPNKKNLGANAILAVSLAAARAGALKLNHPLSAHFAHLAGNKKLVLPVPSFNVINGGSHAGNGLAFQEFMVLPTGASNFAEAMQIGCEIYQNLKKVTKERYGQDAVNVGDEGGFAPPIKNNEEGIKLLMDAIDKSGYLDKVIVGMDVASSEFFVDGKYDLDKKSRPAGSTSQEGKLSGSQLADFYQDLCSRYPIFSIEDAFDQVSVECILLTSPYHCSPSPPLPPLTSLVLWGTSSYLVIYLFFSLFMYRMIGRVGLLSPRRWANRSRSWETTSLSPILRESNELPRRKHATPCFSR